jgi:ethanolamine utilization cobalamin adenosyltransferase
MGSTLEEQNKEAPEPNRYYDASYKRHLVTESSRGRRAARLEVLKYEEGGSVTEDLKRNDGRIAKKTKVY